MIISLDTETTGLDLYHGCRPYFVTITREDKVQLGWEWDVDPLTRMPRIPLEDILDVQEEIKNATILVTHNGKFDYQALEQAEPGFVAHWDWVKVRDTLYASHLLASQLERDLTTVAKDWLKKDISPYEKALEVCAQECRRWCRTHKKTWRIGKDGDPMLPSGSGWKGDGWLCRAVAAERDLPVPGQGCKHLWGQDHLCQRCKGHRYWVVLSQYGHKDSEVTLAVWLVMEQQIKTRKLEAIYYDRLKIIPVNVGMERRGVIASKPRLDEQKESYVRERDRCREACEAVAASLGVDLQMPAGGRSDKLEQFCFGPLGLPVMKRTDSGKPSMDKYVMEDLELSLPTNSKEGVFVRNFRKKRARDTTLNFIAAYERFWRPLQEIEYPSTIPPEERVGYYRLHPQLNPCGTKTTRWACQNPNEQNISKRGVGIICPDCKGRGKLDGEDCRRCWDKDEKFSTGQVPRTLRDVFVAPPGYELWSMDGKNLELRIPSYGAGEREMIGLFEEPNKPPYYGSNHMLNFHTIYPDLWEAGVKEVGPEKVAGHLKKKYADSWYQWCKNGGFAVLYGAVDRPDGGGTADLAFRKRGAHALLKARFARMEAYNQRWIQFADRHGYVETMPRRPVDPHRGYPLLCTRSGWNKILPTVPLNYHVQGTACLWMQDAMLRCEAQFEEWARESKGAYVGWIMMQIHDELVFCLPKRAHPKADPKRSNLGRVRTLQKHMEQGGVDINVPTPTSCEYHEHSWAEGISL